MIRRAKSLKATRCVLAVLAIILAVLWIMVGLHVYRCHVVERKAIKSKDGGLLIEPVGPTWIHDRLGNLGRLALGRPTAVLLVFDSTDSRAEIDGVFSALAGLHTLEQIYLKGESITDANIQRLRGFSRLRHLSLGEMRITPAGFAALEDLPALRDLTLWRSPAIDDAALIPISRISGLTGLSLSGTSVTDTGMSRLFSLKELLALNLDHTAITNAGLLELRGLTNLRHLSVSQTGVTEAGIAELRESLPELEVSDD